MGQFWPIREGPLTQVDLEPTWGWGGGAPTLAAWGGGAAALGLGAPLGGPT